MNEIRRDSYTPFFDGIISDIVSIPIAEGRKLLMLSGVAAQNPEGKPFQSNVVSADCEEQVRHIWKRIAFILEQHGATVADVVKIVTYVTDARYLVHPTSKVLREVFAGKPVPVSTGLVVSGLAYPEMLIEVDVTAVTG
ncbi:Rid family hydrolase [Sphingobium phenoxybenzoativorans]|uniref:Rid family hydrolase n=1 Tax=Sphingobium phenoxybenzoativorans TaxID=1592790 RepID=UPI000872D706|nr:Rid family hydrolase [Sphingobium phenoxybenzoativorans]